MSDIRDALKGKTLDEQLSFVCEWLGYCQEGGTFMDDKDGDILITVIEKAKMRLKRDTKLRDKNLKV